MQVFLKRSENFVQIHCKEMLFFIILPKMRTFHTMFKGSFRSSAIKFQKKSKKALAKEDGIVYNDKVLAF